MLDAKNIESFLSLVWIEFGDPSNSTSVHLYNALADPLKDALSRLEKAEAALNFVADFPNGPGNHSDMCELMTHEGDEDDRDDDACCDCEYWAASFPILKACALSWRSSQPSAGAGEAGKGDEDG